MRFDASMESLINIGRSESYADLNNPDFGIARSFLSPQNSRDLLFINSGEIYEMDREFFIKFIQYISTHRTKYENTSQFEC